MNINRDIVNKKLEVSDELIRNLDQLNIFKNNIKKFYNIEFSRYFFPNSQENSSGSKNRLGCYAKFLE